MTCTLELPSLSVDIMLSFFRVAVLDEGKLVEYGPIGDLLSNEGSQFSIMATKAGLRKL